MEQTEEGEIMTSRLAIILLAILYGFVETTYFGGNFFPKSDAEMICDGIGLILFSLAFLVPKDQKI